MKLNLKGYWLVPLTLMLCSCHQFNSYTDVINNYDVLKREYKSDELQCVLTFQPLWLMHYIEQRNMSDTLRYGNLAERYGNYLNFILEVTSIEGKRALSVDENYLRKNAVLTSGDAYSLPKFVQEETIGFSNKKRFIITYPSPTDNGRVDADMSLVITSNNQGTMNFQYNETEFNNINLITD